MNKFPLDNSMNDDIKLKRFESRDLSYYELKDYDFSKELNNVSFFRSDFRGSKFNNVKFYKNEFDRSDFLHAYFINCTFKKVNFGCCQIKNCYFENVTFSDNYYMNTSIHSTTFVNCKFIGEKFLINMQRCKLKNCTFEECIFERSTTDTDEFEGCDFVKTNLATMHAENHTFIECTFKDVFMDSSYYYGYLMANCSPIGLFFLYRGEYVAYDKMNSEEMLKDFINQKRFTEILNIYIQHSQFLIPDLVKEFINYYRINKYGSSLDMANFFNALIFYSIYEKIEFSIMYEILGILENEKWEGYDISEKMDILPQVSRVKYSLFYIKHSKRYISNFNNNSFSSITFKFDNDNLEECEQAAESILSVYSDTKYWVLTDKKKGCWELTYTMATIICAYIIPDLIIKYGYTITTVLLLGKAWINCNNNKISKKEFEIQNARIRQTLETLSIPNKGVNKLLVKSLSNIIAKL